ncbi:hypothetical protein FA15DRAFT_704070 [Coprinopsis marcescibilis]|uniref:Uncharacterized protein n=1 Tax=Coprinopsis marcescibilis TaxID=230819 RepID=A0A5C3KXD6_COPMA|nr:hypothetical protein FA15DRAFT_704070 [Coprinopsis marcescibilis]
MATTNPSSSSSEKKKIKVEERNAELFKTFEKIFEDASVKNHDRFRSAAVKLAVWLKDSRGYYPNARKEIVKLLMVAQISLRRQHAGAGTDILKIIGYNFPPEVYQNHPLRDAYIQLVRAIYPHIHLFVEQDLKTPLCILLHSIGINDFPESLLVPSTSRSISASTPTGALRTGDSPVSTPIPSAITSSYPHSTPVGHQAPFSVSEGNVLRNEKGYPEGTSPSNAAALLSNPATSRSSSISSHTVTNASAHPKPALIPTSEFTNNAISTQTATTIPTANAPNVHTKGSTVTRVKKKKKPIDIAALQQRDIESFKQRVASTLAAPAAPITSTSDVPAEAKPEEPVSGSLSSDLPRPTTGIVVPSAANSEHPGAAQPPTEVITERNQEVLNTNQPDLSEAVSPTERIFGDDFRVLSLQRGLPAARGSIIFAFDLTNRFFELAIQWKNRTGTLSELSGSICLSLGCFPVGGLALDRPFEEQVTALSSSWPKDGGLSAKFHREGDKIKLPLAPPFTVTPDNTFDIASFIQPGKNSFEVVQSKDWSQFVFVLFIHHPTEAQMDKVRAKRTKDNDWENWKREMSKPLPVKIPKYEL